MTAARPAALWRFPMNLTFHTLGDVLVPMPMQRLLSAGTKYIPKDAQHVVSSTAASLAQFKTSIAWATKFGWHHKQGEVMSLFHSSSSALPPDITGPLALHVQAIETEVTEALKGKRTQSKDSQLAAKFMRIRAATLIVRPADKNLGLCVMSREAYFGLLAPQLTVFDTPVEATPEKIQATVSHVRSRLLSAFESAKAMLDPNVFSYLVDSESKCATIPVLYVLPKLHKTPVAGRPIAAEHEGCISAPSSNWLAAILQPLAQSIPWILPDGNKLVHSLLTKPIQSLESAVLVTADVTAMYPNMNFRTMEDSLVKAVTRFQPDWIQLLPLCLTITKILFEECFVTVDGKMYRQKTGVKMGTHAAPPLANIYMFPLEEFLLKRHEGKVLHYYRFIDDIFALFTSQDAADKFTTEFNEMTHLQLDWKTNSKSADFLDVTIFKGPLMRFNLLDVRTFRKSMNKYLYIPPFSSHSGSNLTAWVRGEILRVRRTNTQDDVFEDNVCFFLNKLRHRGYGEEFLWKTLKDIPQLYSPLVFPPRLRNFNQVADARGQVFKKPPPHIFRAPFSADLVIPFGAIIKRHLPQILQLLPQLTQGDWLPNPNPPPLDRPYEPHTDPRMVMLYEQVRTNFLKDASVAARVILDIETICQTQKATLDALLQLPIMQFAAQPSRPIIMAKTYAKQLIRRISRANVSSSPIPQGLEWYNNHSHL